MAKVLASIGFCRCVVLALGCLIAGEIGSTAQAGDWSRSGGAPEKPADGSKAVGIPGEFERQAALVLSWKSEELPILGTLLEIGAHAAKKAPVVVLVGSPQERQHAEVAFAAAKVARGQMRFLEAPADTIWARDFGPVVVRNSDGSAHFVDSDYDTGGRPQDDNIPPLLAGAMGARCIRSLLTIEGGNLLSNGAGLCVTTSKSLADNVLRGYQQEQIEPLMKRLFQCREIAVLEPLIGEPTGHVDMFATFTSPDTVIVASIDPKDDPVNAAVLDRNAKTLAGLTTPRGRLRVERIPMPARDEELWRSYTNVLYINGLVMMPRYGGVDPRMETLAADTYRRLLPGWEVKGIDCTKLIQLGGAVHCVTLNLPAIKPPGREHQVNAPAQAFPIPVRALSRPPEWFDPDEAPAMFLPAPGSERNPFPNARPFRADDEGNPIRPASGSMPSRDRRMFDYPERAAFPEDR